MFILWGKFTTPTLNSMLIVIVATVHMWQKYLYAQNLQGALKTNTYGMFLEENILSFLSFCVK